MSIIWVTHGTWSRPQEFFGESSPNNFPKVWDKIWVWWRFRMLQKEFHLAKMVFKAGLPVRLLQAILGPTLEPFWPGEILSEWPEIATPNRFCSKFSGKSQGLESSKKFERPSKVPTFDFPDIRQTIKHLGDPAFVIKGHFVLCIRVFGLQFVRVLTKKKKCYLSCKL